MNLYFRTDASNEIGSGHVIRCLTLAKKLRERGCCCHFICRYHEGNLIELIQKDGFALLLFSSATDGALQTQPNSHLCFDRENQNDPGGRQTHFWKPCHRHRDPVSGQILFEGLRVAGYWGV